MTKQYVSISFDPVTVPARSRGRAVCHTPTTMTVDRIVLPRSAIGRFRVASILSGIQQIVSQGWDTERFVSLESPSPFGEFDAFCNQRVCLEIENITEQEETLDEALLRGTAIEGHVLQYRFLEALLDRGKALQAQEDTTVYGRGWTAAVEQLTGGLIPFRHLEPRFPL